MAGVAYNGLAMVKAALRQVHGAEAIDDGVSSGYSLVNDMACVAERLATLVEPQDWAVFQTLSLAVMAAWLVETAGRAQLRKYRQHPRGPKKPPVSRAHDPHRPHVSVARLVAPRQQAKGAATP